jgi:hypothetical protein
VLSEKDGTGAAGAQQKAAEAGFELGGTPYGSFIDRYFAT